MRNDVVYLACVLPDVSKNAVSLYSKFKKYLKISNLYLQYKFKN